MEKELKPFDKVLVRDSDTDVWEANLYSRYEKSEPEYCHICMDYGYNQCIPYEGNEHLLGTRDKAKPKRWRAEYHGHYFYIDSLGDVVETVDMGEYNDNRLYKVGNYFETKEEAKEVAKKVKALFEGH